MGTHLFLISHSTYPSLCSNAGRPFLTHEHLLPACPVTLSNGTFQLISTTLDLSLDIHFFSFLIILCIFETHHNTNLPPNCLCHLDRITEPVLRRAVRRGFGSYGRSNAPGARGIGCERDSSWLRTGQGWESDREGQESHERRSVTPVLSTGCCTVY